MRTLEFDQWGMILQGGDGGDSAANMGTYHIFLQTRRNMGHVMFNDGPWPASDLRAFVAALWQLEAPGSPIAFANVGLYRRHPDLRYWTARTNTMSRDQTIPLLGAMALYKHTGRVVDYLIGHAKRLFLFTTNTTPNWSDPISTPNTLTTWQRVKFFFGWDPGRAVYALKIPDITLFEFWALELRGLYRPWAWPVIFPLVLFADLFTVFGSLDKVFVYAKDATNNDDRNHVNTMLVGLQICPTPLVRLAANIYSMRPRAGYDKPSEVSGPQSALDHYYGPVDAPPLNELGRPIMKYYFERWTKWT